MTALLALLTFMAISGSTGGSTGGTVKGPISKSLILVSDIDGKYIYYDSTVERNWTASGQYCQENGMQLAAITSQVQAEDLDKSWTFPDYQGEYWTAGRDARQHRQFSWNTTNEEVSADFLDTVFTSPFDYLTCILYHSNYNGGGSGIHFWPCHFKAYVLCEIDWDENK